MLFIPISRFNSPFLQQIHGESWTTGRKQLAWIPTVSLMGADEQGGVQVQAEGRVERLSELALKSVQEHHCVRHAVEGQSPLLALQEHADPGAGRGSHRGLAVVVPSGISRMRAPQPPGVLVAPKQAGLSAPFASDTSVCDADVDPSSAPPLHLPVAGTGKLTLLAQDLRH